ncbi:MAG: TonB-dependent receptor plug domain-containing protein, partial [Bacteroidota bacterium]
DDYTAKAELESYLGGNHFVTMGLFYTHYRHSYAATTPLTLKRQNIHTAYDLLGAFVQDKISVNDELSVLPGFRITILPHDASLFLEPRVVLSYQLTSTLQTKLGTGLYYQWINGAQPASMFTFSGIDFWYPVERSTSASRAVQLSGDLSWNPDPAYSITVSGYTNWFANLVELKQNFEDYPNFGEMFDTGKGWNAGVELFVERSSGPIRGAVGYTLSWALRQFDDIEEGRIFPARHDKRHTINIVGGVQLSETWSVSVAWMFSSGQAYTGIVGRYSFRPMGFEKLFPPFGYSHSLLSSKNGLRLPVYHRLDVSIGKTFRFDHWKLRLRLDVFNVYNRRNALGANPDFSLNADPYYRLLPIVPTVTVEAEF